MSVIGQFHVFGTVKFHTPIPVAADGLVDLKGYGFRDTERIHSASHLCRLDLARSNVDSHQATLMRRLIALAIRSAVPHPARSAATYISGRPAASKT